MNSNEKLSAELTIKYLNRFRQILHDLTNESKNKILLILKQEALKLLIQEYLRDNPNIEHEITCHVFYTIGDLNRIL